MIEYLASKHGYKSLQPYFSQNLDSLIKSDKTADLDYSYAAAVKLLELMHVKHTGQYETEDNQPNYFSYRRDDQVGSAVNIEEFDYLINAYNFNINNQVASDTYYRSGKQTFIVEFDAKTNKIKLQLNNDSLIEFDVYFLIRSFKEKAYTQFTKINSDSLTLTAKNGDLSGKIMFRSLYGEYSKDGIEIHQITADILVGVKHP